MAAWCYLPWGVLNILYEINILQLVVENNHLWDFATAHVTQAANIVCQNF